MPVPYAKVLVVCVLPLHSMECDSFEFGETMPFKILIVDDEKDIIDFVQHRLLRENYEVFIARDGEEALFKVRESDPDVILLDLVMPKLNGFEVLKAVREQFNDKWRPVIIVSANEELEALKKCYGLEALKKCYGLEADHYLTKPCTIEALLNGIRTMISLIPLRIK